MLKPVTLSAAALGCALLLTRTISAQKAKTTLPLSAAAWTADLRSYGYMDQSVEMDYLYRLRMTHTDVSFLNDQEVVDTFEAIVEDSPKTSPPHYHRQLDVVILDSATGQVREQLSWAAPHYNGWAVPRADGSFAVFLGDRLEFYSADLHPDQELKLNPPPLGQRFVIWFSSSPSGKTMLIQYTSTDETSCVWVTGEAISSQQERCEVPPRAVVSDEEVVTGHVVKDDAGVNHTKVSVKKFQGPWRTLCDGPRVDPCGNPVFLAEDRLVLRPGSRVLFSLERTDGKIIFRSPSGLEASDALNLYAYSEKAQLLAFPVYELGQSAYSIPHAPLTPPFDGAVVYDVSRNKQIFQVKSNEKTGIHLPQGLAISPSGDRLVIEGDGILRCYDLPSAQK